MENEPTAISSLVPISIEEEMKSSFLDYAMSVITARALPDVRDGLKPVHRRILYTMHILKNAWNQPYKKSARVVGDTMGRFHPHGDSALYEALVRMAQPFSLRYLLADGQGNFGSVDGDPPAAMRYTEVRMSKISAELLADIEKETVPFIPNYDEKEEEPLVLPTRVPNLLVNGASGIAVGMATNIPPHNLGEVIDATIAIIRDERLTNTDLLKYIPGPDFPTGGIIYGRAGAYQAYQTGRGPVVMRGKSHIEESKAGRRLLVITEIPFQVNKARLLEKIAELVKEKAIEGISDIRDESDRQGMRVVVTLKKDAVDEVVLNQLYKQTPLQTTFGVNMIAIVGGEPRTLTLRDALGHFIDHRREVVVRRCEFELRQANERQEIVEGLGVAIEAIDVIIATIRASQDTAEAMIRLRAIELSGLGTFLRRAGVPEAEVAAAEARGPYRLSQRQAQAILDMRLQRLTGLQREKLEGEYAELAAEIHRLEAILADEPMLMEVIVQELQTIKDAYGDPRRTEIIDASGEISIEDLIADEDMVLTTTHSGYIKRTPLAEYRAQGRGGKGRKGTSLKDEDVVTDVFVARSHSSILLFTDQGRVYLKKTYEIPLGSPSSRGKALVNVLELKEGEKVVRVSPVDEFSEGKYVFMATRRGLVKKTDLMAFANIRASGIIAIGFEEGDSLINARITEDSHDVFIGSADGQAIRFPVQNVRSMGRTARGVKGISLRGDDEVVGMETLPQDSDLLLLTVCERGFGKCTVASEYPTKNRGGMGVITIKTSERNGRVVGLRLLAREDHVLMVTDHGKLIRLAVSGISVQGRNTQGVTLVRIDEGERVVSVARVSEPEEENGAAIEPSAAPDEVAAKDDESGGVPEELRDTEATTKEPGPQDDQEEPG
ncbi:MAG: DNA gyrase subunit A [Polyangia bacterium]|jgi:DNA gyrase subunit A|nr:DNA gyrase subunit A [Polyangia bacterium]